MVTSLSPAAHTWARAARPTPARAMKMARTDATDLITRRMEASLGSRVSACRRDQRRAGTARRWYVRVKYVSRTGGDVADDSNSRTQGVPGEIREREILHLDHLEAGRISPRPHGPLLGEPSRAPDRLLAREPLEDLVDLAADLGDGSTDGVGHGLMRHVHHLGDAGHALGNGEAAAADGDEGNGRR